MNMAADALQLLFRINSDSRPALADLARLRSAFGKELATVKAVAARSIKLPPLQLPRTGADAHVRDFKRIEAEHAKSTKAQEREQARLNKAVESLQRQRSAAIVAAWKAEQKAAQEAAAATSRAFAGLGGRLPNLVRDLTGATGGFKGLSTSGLAAVGALTAVGAAAFAVGAGLAALVAAGQRAVAVLQEIFERGVAYNSELEQTELGISAIVTSLAELRTAAGRPIEGPEKLNAAFAISRDQLKKLRIDALLTTATFGQIAPAFQTAIGPGLAAGLQLDQVREITVKIVQAATALGIPMHQVSQEVRAIFEGSIDVNARLAKTLGITNEMVKSWKEQGTLAEELNKRLAGFAAAGERAAQTFEGMKSNLQEALQVFTGQATDRAFAEIKVRLSALLKEVFDFKNAGIDKSIQSIAEIIDSLFVEVARFTGDVLADIVAGIKRVGQFLGENRLVLQAIFTLAGQIARAIFDQIKILLGVTRETDAWRKVLAAVYVTLFGVRGLMIAITPLVAAASVALRTLFALVASILPGINRVIQAVELAAKLSGKGLGPTGDFGTDEEAAQLAKVTAAPGARGADKGAASKADAATRARIRLLEIAAQEAQRIYQNETEGLQLEYERRLISTKEYSEKEIDAAIKLLAAKQKVTNAERAEAAKLTKAPQRDVKLAEIRLQEQRDQDEFVRAVAAANERRRQAEEEAERDHRQALLELREQADARELAQVDAFVKKGVLTYFEGERQRAKIESDARKRRIHDLVIQLAEAGARGEDVQRIQNEIAKAGAEHAAATEESERRIREAITKTVVAYGEYRNAIIRVREDALEALRGATEISLQTLARSIGNTRAIVRERAQLAREEAEANNRENLRRLEEQEQQRVLALEGLGDYEQRNLEIHQEYNALREAEAARHAAVMRDIDDEEASETDPFRSLKDQFAQFREGIEGTDDAIAESVGSISRQVVSSLRAMKDALKDGIVGWILYGENLGKALKKALAAQLANIAAEAAIRSLYHAAWALGSLAFGNFAGAAKHAAAAAAFAGIAAAAGLAGRSLAKSAGLHGGGAAAAVAPTGPQGHNDTRTDRPFTLDRPAAAQVVEHKHTIEVVSNDSHILKVWQEDARNNGMVRQTVINLATAG